MAIGLYLCSSIKLINVVRISSSCRTDLALCPSCVHVYGRVVNTESEGKPVNRVISKLSLRKTSWRWCLCLMTNFSKVNMKQTSAVLNTEIMIWNMSLSRVSTIETRPEAFSAFVT